MPSPSGYVLNPIEVGGAVVAAQPLPDTPFYENLLSSADKSIVFARDLPYNVFKPSAAIAETFPRHFADLSAGLTSGRLHCTGIYLKEGTVVTSITFLSGATAISAATSQWFALYNSGYTLCRQTADVTSQAWGTNVLKTLALSSPYVVPRSGIYYLGVMVAASTPPALWCQTANGNPAFLDPKISIRGDASLTATAPTQITLGVGETALAWAYVS